MLIDYLKSLFSSIIAHIICVLSDVNVDMTNIWRCWLFFQCRKLQCKIISFVECGI